MTQLRSRISAYVCFGPQTDIGTADSIKTPARGRGSAKEGFVGQNALLFEPLSFCSFACFRQATDFAALCSSCWVGLTFCATRSDFDVASDELCAVAGSPASPRTITKILVDTKRRMVPP
jgi:hypothetical protein